MKLLKLFITALLFLAISGVLYLYSTCETALVVTAIGLIILFLVMCFALLYFFVDNIVEEILWRVKRKKQAEEAVEHFRDAREKKLKEKECQ